MTPRIDPDRYKHDILTVAQTLHVTRWGSADPLPPEERAELRDWLTRRLETWQPSLSASWAGYDEAVRRLCQAALAEGDE